MGWKRDECGNIKKCRAATHSNSAVGKDLRNYQLNVPDIDGHFTELKPNPIVRVPAIITYFALGRHMFAQSS